MSGNSKHGTDELGNHINARGRDDYFNNGVYSSGWTYFGNTISSPYFTTKPVDVLAVSPISLGTELEKKVLNINVMCI